MRGKHLGWILGVAGLATTPPAMAQAVMNAPPSRAEGALLRPVAVPASGHLVYEYQGSAGAAQLRVDPTSLVNDIERARKRVVKKKADTRLASASPTPPAASLRQPEMAQADIEAPVAEVPPAAQGERKVRVIPLYNVPKAD